MGAPFVLQTMEYLAGRFFRSERSLVIDGDKHVGIIDPGFSSSSVSEVLQHCRSYGKSVTHVVLSHAHNDHVANIDDYADAFPSLKIIVSQNSPFAVRDETIVCDDGESMRIADVDCCFLHTPGHSRRGDDISVYVPYDRFLFCGDLAQPHGDCFEHATFASPVPFYYLGDEYLRSLDRLQSLDFHILMTGHGDVLEQGAARNWLQVTRRVIEMTRNLAYELVGQNRPESDATIAEWVFRTLAHERSLSQRQAEERMCEVDGISDYERYDLPGIRYWVRLARQHYNRNS